MKKKKMEFDRSFRLSYTTMERLIKKYENALISIASFSDGAIVSGRFDEPGSAEEARKALGKVICKICLKQRNL